jgi:hypothetical protein
MEALFEKKLGTRKTIVKELSKIRKKLDEDVDYYKTFGCFEQIEKIRNYQNTLQHSIHHLEVLIAEEDFILEYFVG